MKQRITFIDTEVGVGDHKVHDYGALTENAQLHSHSRADFSLFIKDADYLCGHNLIHHDLQYLSSSISLEGKRFIDTLYLSPLLFPRKPYHKLLKDDKLQVDELNNPLNDCMKARDLFYDEVNVFDTLDEARKNIYCKLLYPFEEYQGFFDFMGRQPQDMDWVQLVKDTYQGLICEHANILSLIMMYPRELAYALALIGVQDFASITPAWVVRNFPQTENVINYLCGTPCQEGCPYCQAKHDIHKNLKSFFGYDQFRLFDGEPLQEQAVQAAVNGESLLTIFPTGGGKSLTFQLPALMAGRNAHGLTVVISPLQSLMKDQVDNLANFGITEAVTINGLLDPIERAVAFERVADGSASLLYIAPESLRSKTIEKLLLSRNVVRFVIDEAHCFSAWGQDFRVDYLYIGDFIKKLQEMKEWRNPIPVSCFTATAKQKVIMDIHDYFQKILGIDLKIYAASATRQNLTYSVIHAETEEDKYNILRNLLSSRPCPTIIYTSRTRKSVELAEKLSKDGFPALPFHGKMDSQQKIDHQNAFISGDCSIIVATSAFGMGVDKKDVGLVIHYDISDSLENYVQEAGRAGRDPNMQASCYVLYGDNDLDKHFLLLNQTKLSISEIQQVWQAIKYFTKKREYICCSPLEIARQAGWNEDVADVETRVKTAIAALEKAGYVSRGNNVPHVYATGIRAKNMEEARRKLTSSPLFSEHEKELAIRVIKSLISSRSIATDTGDDAESRIDYLADRLGMTKEAVVNVVNLMRQDGILADTRDMTAYFESSDTENKAKKLFTNFAKLERFIIERLKDDIISVSYKTLNESAQNHGINNVNIKNIRTILNFLKIKGYIQKKEDLGHDNVLLSLCQDLNQSLQKHEKRVALCDFILDEFFMKANAERKQTSDEVLIQFSIIELLNKYNNKIRQQLFNGQQSVSIQDVEEALLYLSRIGAIRMEGGFLVLYNAMEIKRLTDPKLRYKVDDYRMLNEFYKQKIQQIHILGEYANLMVRDYDAALQYVQDYFQMDYKKFIVKYFKGERLTEITKNITPTKYKKLFGDLSERQREIIDDKQSKYIVVAAGPGSGKTKVLVHKLAALLLMEDVKHEQLLMLTFSRAAATEFKTRLMGLIGNAAHFVEIKTFHSYSFDLLGKTGNLEDAQDVVQRAADLIEHGEVEQGKIRKTVLVIDEAQDMDEHEFALVRALMNNNEDLRVIAVGDDDQNIFQFRGSDAKHLQLMIDELEAKKYEMTDNFRSDQAIVSFAEDFIRRLPDRMKTTRCVSVRGKKGKVCVTRHYCEHFEIPLIAELKAVHQGESTCILTNTNEEAAQLVFMLNEEGIQAKLIQSMDGFRFSDLAEVRYFMKQLGNSEVSPIIDEYRWDCAKEKTLRAYRNNRCLEYLKTFFQQFEGQYKEKYRSDFQEYVFESRLEDFCPNDKQSVMVSTIHKSKGREFDTVFMMLRQEPLTPETVRKYYVGMTRARHSLHIHCNTSLFAGLEGVEYKEDPTVYPEPRELVIQLTHHDVFLDHVKGRKEVILGLRSGMSLTYRNGYFYSESGLSVAYLSSKMRQELSSLESKGYTATSAEVGYVLAWRPKGTTKEQAVVLPVVKMEKQENNQYYGNNN